MSHVTYGYDSWHRWVMSYIHIYIHDTYESCHIRISALPWRAWSIDASAAMWRDSFRWNVIHTYETYIHDTYESCHIYIHKWVVSHMSHVTYGYDSWHTWVMWQTHIYIYMPHTSYVTNTYINEPCQIWVRFMTHMSHVTYTYIYTWHIWVTSHMHIYIHDTHESCHIYTSAMPWHAWSIDTSATMWRDSFRWNVIHTYETWLNKWSRINVTYQPCHMWVRFMTHESCHIYEMKRDSYIRDVTHLCTHDLRTLVRPCDVTHSDVTWCD